VKHADLLNDLLSVLLDLLQLVKEIAEGTDEERPRLAWDAEVAEELQLTVFEIII